MGMHAFRRLREQEAAAVAAASIDAVVTDRPNNMPAPADFVEEGTFDKHPSKRRGRRSAATPTQEN